MKLVHVSAYPGISTTQFYRLMADNPYQDALAGNAKLTRENVRYAPQPDGLESSWDACVKRTLRQPHLRPLRAVFPNGVEVRWSERHGYQGSKGWLKLHLEKPSFVNVDIEGTEALSMQGDTLVRRIEIDFGKAKLPLGIGVIPGVQAAVAKEVDAGLTRSDERTRSWLREHPHDYDTPAPSEACSDDEDTFEDALGEQPGA